MLSARPVSIVLQACLHLVDLQKKPDLRPQKRLSLCAEYLRAKFIVVTYITGYQSAGQARFKTYRHAIRDLRNNIV
jgi:hypothetical protein